LSSFASLGVPAELSTVLSRLGLTEPFPIQAAALPDAFAGRDVCGRAPTGSGKTLAFGLPVVASVAAIGHRLRRPAALILVPTRELAAPVERTIAPLAAAANARVVSIYGGVSYGKQRAALQRGVEIVVGCPGRLEDLIEQGDLVLSDVSMVVVDEADRMADMGFLPAVRRLLDATRSDRQTLLFSATLDGEVDVLIRRYQHEPARHEVVADEEATGDVVHAFWRAEQSDRAALTAAIISAHAPAVVFCRTRHGADRLTKRLEAAGVGAAPIHGARSQAQRDRALASFSAGSVQALVATDVAARGIHVDDVACVIHYDLPADAKDYVHRSGRTGRAGADGIVVSLVGSDQAKVARTVQKQLDLPVGVTAPDLDSLPETPPFVPKRPAPRSGATADDRRGPRGANRYAGGAGGRSGTGRSGGYSGGSHSAGGHPGAARTGSGRPGGGRNGGGYRGGTTRSSGDGAAASQRGQR
jgi:superfamily II DNA/RNA helicase